MSKRVKRGNRCYPISLKRRVAEAYLNGEFSYAVGAERYNLPGKDTVKEFVKWYKRQLKVDPLLTHLDKAAPPPATASNSTDETARELERLRRELYEARLENTALRTAIDIAERDLQVDLLKKFVTEQSGK